MNIDEYGEIINGIFTYQTIASKLKEGKSCIIGWTDEESTHYDILFCNNVYKEQINFLQRGLQPNYLYVSIIGTGSFGFIPNGTKYPSYIAEKIFNGRTDSSIEKVTELINGIIKEMENRK